MPNEVEGVSYVIITRNWCETAPKGGLLLSIAVRRKDAQ